MNIRNIVNGKIKSEKIFSYTEGITRVKQYKQNGNLSFEGEYLYGHRKFGKEYKNEKLIYEGEYLYERKRNGKGYDKKVI